MRLGLVFAVVLMAGPSALSAPLRANPAPEQDGSSSRISNLYSCRTLEPDADRLACFDREVLALQEAQASQEIVIADQSDMREARRGLFGFALPKVKLFGGRDDDEKIEDVSEIEETLATFGSSGGKVSFTLEGGARWVQTDNVPVYGTPGAGDRVLIKKAALGSYIAKIEGGRAIRVKRLD